MANEKSQQTAGQVTRKQLIDLLNEDLARDTRPSSPMWSIRRC